MSKRQSPRTGKRNTPRSRRRKNPYADIQTIGFEIEYGSGQFYDGDCPDREYFQSRVEDLYTSEFPGAAAWELTEDASVKWRCGSGIWPYWDDPDEVRERLSDYDLLPPKDDYMVPYSDRLTQYW